MNEICQIFSVAKDILPDLSTNVRFRFNSSTKKVDLLFSCGAAKHCHVGSNNVPKAHSSNANMVHSIPLCILVALTVALFSLFFFLIT